MSIDDNRWRRRTVALLACASIAVLAACGTRLSDRQIISAQDGAGSVSGGASDNGAISGRTVNGNGDSLNAAGSTGGPATGGSPAGVGGMKASGAAGGSTTGGAGGVGAPRITGGGAVGGARGGGSANVPCTREGEPIIIGQDGSFSGLVGESTSNVRTGLSVWTRYINSLGGIQCHPIQLYQEDNGSDPSKTAANINDLVRNKHAIAIVGENAEIVMASARSAAAQLGVPIVGGDLSATDWTKDANVFPSGGSALSVYGGAVVQAVKDTGAKKIGLLYCVEASICGDVHRNYGWMVAPSHGTIVYEQSMSLTQSSFTAECQNAKSAGVQVLFLTMEGASAQRTARSCDAIGFHPTYVTAGIAASPNMLNDPNLKSAGLYIGSNEAPFIMNNLPALRTFHRAFEQFYGGPPPDQSAMKGWVSGQLFAAAINAFGSAARNVPVTTEMIYQGLYRLKNETLGGLLPPMNYVKGKPAPIVPCYTTLKDTRAGLVAPGGSRFVCS